MTFLLQLLLDYHSALRIVERLGIAFSPIFKCFYWEKNVNFWLASPEKSSAELFEIRPGLFWAWSLFTASPKFRPGPPSLFLFIFPCKAFYSNDLQTGHSVETFQRLWQVVFAFRLILAHGRESWVGVTVVSWLYKTEWLPSSRTQLKTRCSLRSFVGSSELFGLQCWSW